MKLGYSTEPLGPTAFALSANLAKLIPNWNSVVTYDTNLYPATISESGTAYAVFLVNDIDANGIDSTYFPTQAVGIGTSTGIFTLIYDDATMGVSSGNPKLTVKIACPTRAFRDLRALGAVKAVFPIAKLAGCPAPGTAPRSAASRRSIS